MPRVTSTGICEFCKERFNKQGIGRHLKKCPARPTEAGIKEVHFHLLVEGYGAPMYWLHLEIPARARLTLLDSFLRNIWLECCGHLSAFYIGHASFHSDPDGAYDEDARSMNTALSKVIDVGMKFKHDYDFGSTTTLQIKVVGCEERPAKKRSAVTLLARNTPPDIPCDICGKPATHLCTECVYDGGGCLCGAHADVHECGEEMLLPVVNSPRVGVCAYGG